MADLIGEICAAQNLEGQINIEGASSAGSCSVSVNGEILVFSSGASVSNEVLEVS